jgi:acyl carrier protein
MRKTILIAAACGIAAVAGSGGAEAARAGSHAHSKVKAETAARVKKILVEHLGVDAGKVTMKARFIEDLGADSLDVVELVMAFEEEFGIEVPDDAAEKIIRVRDAVAYVDSHRT